MWRLTLILVFMAAAAQAKPEQVALNGRYYLIELPDQAQGAPVVMGLHGGGGNPAQFARNAGLSAPALAQGYAVIYPAGSGRGAFLTWNGGYCCGYAARRGADDLGFLEQVIADAAARFGVDAQRVYLTGMSNGAIMAEAFAATHPGAVRAVAGVSGTLDLAQYPPQGPVPMMQIHGTADRHVPYQGGQGSSSLTRTDFTPVDQVIAAFRRPFGPLAESQGLIDPVADGMQTEWRNWSRSGVPMVRLMTVQGGGHVWQGGHRARNQQGASGDIDATAEILAFFALHP